MTVAELADELGLTVKEVVSLCMVAGIAVGGGSAPLSDSDVERVHMVLEGKVAIPDKGTGRRRSGPPMRLRTVLIVLSLAFVSLIVGGVLWLMNREASITVRSGDCFEDPGMIGNRIDPVPCNEEHDFKAYATIDMNSVWTTWPGVEEVESHAQERCQQLAIDTGTMSFEIYYFGPMNERTWEDAGARRIVCAVPD